MNLDKYQRAWKAEASQVRVSFDADLLSKEVQKSHEAFRSMIFWRDLREVGTSLVMIPIWIVMGIVTVGNAERNSNWAAWAENWNRIIPSWREVAIIVVPTLAGAYCGCEYPIPDVAPVFFQSVVAAVIPFEIAFFSLWYFSYQRHKGQPLSGIGKVCPHAPAMVTIATILLISTLAFAALLSFGADLKSRQGPGLEAVSAPVDDSIR